MRQPPGGLNTFLIGALIIVSSSMMLLKEIDAVGGFFTWFGTADRTYLVFAGAIVVGVALLLFLGVNVPGMLLALLGLGFVLAGGLVHFGVHSREGSTWNMAFGLFGTFAGVGMVCRAVLPPDPPKPAPGPPVN